MRIQSIARVAALGALLGGLACGKNLDTMAKPDETAASRDSSAQNTSGYKPMERDTTLNGAKGDTLNPGVDSTMPADSVRH